MVGNGHALETRSLTTQRRFLLFAYWMIPLMLLLVCLDLASTWGWINGCGLDVSTDGIHSYACPASSVGKNKIRLGTILGILILVFTSIYTYRLRRSYAARMAETATPAKPS